jgi:hypothetical protein
MESGSQVVGFDPYVSYFRIPAGGYFPMLGRALINGGVGGGTAGFASMLNQSASFSQNTYGEFAYAIHGPNPSNAGTDGSGYFIPANINGLSYAISGVNLNVYNGKVELFPAVASTNARFSGNSNNPRDSGYKGVSSLFKWKGTHTAVGLTQPYTLTGYTLSVASPTARDWLCVSDTVFPWFGVIPSGTTENNEAMEAVSSSVHFSTSSNWFSGSMVFAVDDSAYLTTTVLGSTGSFLFRGRVGATYVYNVGTPPAGAVDVVIIKFGN